LGKSALSIATNMLTWRICDAMSDRFQRDWFCAGGTMHELNVELIIYNCALFPVYHGAEMFVRIR